MRLPCVRRKVIELPLSGRGRGWVESVPGASWRYTSAGRRGTGGGRMGAHTMAEGREHCLLWSRGTTLHCWSTDRVAAGRWAARAGAAAARRAARAGAWSSRAAGRAGPARAWRGRGRRSWVAPSLRCERPPTERVRETLPCERRFFPTVFFAGAGRGGRPMAARPPRRGPPPPRLYSYLRAVY